MFVDEHTQRLSSVFDEMFNLNHMYKVTHKLYENALITFQQLHQPVYYVFRDGVPVPVGYLNARENHFAGFEGSTQKKWTIYTISAILEHASSNAYNISVLGQGDNEVVALEIPEGSRVLMTKFTNDYIQSLTNYFDDLGLPIKAQETYASSELIVYGRNFFYNGAEVPSPEKRVRGMMAEANDSIPTLGMEVATICTSGEAMSKVSLSVIPGLVMSLSNTLIYLSRVSELRPEMLEKSIAVLFLGRIVGGLPISPPPINHFYRGHEDKLTYYLSLYKHIHVNYPLVWKELKRILMLKVLIDKQYINLVIDPHSLNVSTAREHKDLHEILVQKTTNPDLKKWFDRAPTELEDIFVTQLLSIGLVIQSWPQKSTGYPLLVYAGKW